MGDAGQAAAAAISGETAVRRPLRIGLLLDSLVVPAWIARIIEGIVVADFAMLALVVVNNEHVERSPREAVREIAPTFLFRLYAAADYRLFRQADDVLEPVDLTGELAEVPRLDVVPLRTKRWEHRFTEADLDALRAADLDVILRFGFNVIRGGILDAARCGVWSFHHGDNRRFRGGPALFWEMFHGDPVTGAILQRLREELDAGDILARWFIATDPVSMTRSRNVVFWRSADVLLGRLRDLHDFGWDSLRATPEYQEERPTTATIYRYPKNRHVARFAGRAALEVAGNRLQRNAKSAEWSIAYRRRSGPLSLPPDTAGFRLISPPRGRFYADPCIVRAGGRELVFFEDFDYRLGKGVISLVELFSQDEASQPQVVLDLDVHVSYPFVFERGGEFFMIPETVTTRQIQLFRAVEFPEVWRFDRVLVDDVAAADTTFFESPAGCWLFTCPITRGATSGELALYHAESLDEPWRPHPRNPVVADVRSARPAGGLFRHGEMLVRPAQDASRGYGYAVVFNEVETLSPDEYREVPFAHISPASFGDFDGVHTYSVDDQYELIDLRRWVWRLDALERRRRGES